MKEQESTIYRVSGRSPLCNGGSIATHDDFSTPEEALFHQRALIKEWRRHKLKGKRWAFRVERITLLRELVP